MLEFHANDSSGLFLGHIFFGQLHVFSDLFVHLFGEQSSFWPYHMMDPCGPESRPNPSPNTPVSITSHVKGHHPPNVKIKPQKETESATL